MYKQFRNTMTGEVEIFGVIRISGLTFIPFDPANKDYQEYLEWLAEGNEPLFADTLVVQDAE